MKTNAKALMDAKPSDIPALIKAFCSGHSGTERKELLEKAIISLATVSPEPLIAALEASKAIATVAKLLGKLGDVRAVEPLIRVFSQPEDPMDPYYWNWRAVADALGRIGDRRALPVLLNIAEDADRYHELRKAALEAVGSIGDPATLDFLVAFANSTNKEDERIRASAASAIGRMKDERAFEALLSLLYSDEYEVVQESVDALGEIGDRRAVGPLLELFHRPGGKCSPRYLLDALGKLRDPKAVDDLITYMNCEATDHTEFKLTVRALGKIGDARAVEHLLYFIQNYHLAARRGDTCTNLKYIVDALAEIGDIRAIEPLKRLLVVNRVNWFHNYTYGPTLENTISCTLDLLEKDKV